MKKSILSLGAQELSKKEQKIVSGGKAPRCCIDWNPIERVCYAWQPNCL